MKLLTRKTDYGLRLLVEVASEPEGFMSSAKLSRRTGVSLAFTRSLVRQLVRANWLQAHEGRKGGVKLKVSPERISVRHVVELFQGPVRLSGCLLGGKVCPRRATCGLSRRLGKMEQEINTHFEEVTIKNLASAKKMKNKRRRDGNVLSAV